MNPADHPDATRPAAAALIRISVNGLPQSVPAMTLAQWVASAGAAPESLATAVNGEFVARDARAARLLRDGDAVMSFQPIQGG